MIISLSSSTACLCTRLCRKGASRPVAGQWPRGAGRSFLHGLEPEGKYGPPVNPKMQRSSHAVGEPKNRTVTSCRPRHGSLLRVV